MMPAVQEVWNAWEMEIHCLILVSLFLQVFLFAFAGFADAQHVAGTSNCAVAGLSVS